MASKEERLEQLRREEAELEAATYGTAGQDEQVLDDKEVVNPGESEDLFKASTDALAEDTTTPEHTTVKPTGEEGLRKELADLQHRWNRYKGSTDRTLYELRKEVKDLTDDLISVRTQNAELRDKVNVAPVVSEDVFSQDIVNILGEETVEAIKASSNSAHEQLKQIQAKLDAQETDRIKQKREDAEAENGRKFMDGLLDLVPDLNQMNADPKFNTWLREQDSYGIERLTTLREDQSRGDFRRVAQFFIEYKNLPQGTKREVTDTVDNHTGPTGTKTSESNTFKDPANTGWVKQSDINKYNRDLSKGVYKYDSAKAEAFEELIFTAYNNGKVLMDEQPI